MEAAIEARDLCKYYGEFRAVSNVSFTIPAGQVVAFLGPNGAGKSTTMRMLTGFIAPSAGTARVMGKPVGGDRTAIAPHIGYLPENGPLYNDMTPRGILEFLGSARGLAGPMLRDRIDHVVGKCRLGEVIGKPVAKLSKGFRQRVGMAQCMLHDPEILIMDEPTSGLDPNQIREVRAMLREMGKSKTILLSTHILQEVEAVAERVLFIHEGRLAFDGPVGEFLRAGKDMDAVFAALTGAGAAAVA